MDSTRGLASWIRESDERQDEWALAASTFAILALFFVVGGFYVATVAVLSDPGTLARASVRALANMAVSLLFCALLWFSGVVRLRASWRSAGRVLTAAAIAAFARNWAFVATGVVDEHSGHLHVAEFLAGVAFFTTSALLGLRYMPWHLGSNLPFIGWLLGLVNILMIFRADRRCGHDLIAGTQVVKAR